MARALSIEPIVGDWYASHGERFEVVAVDDGERTVEVQYADGTLAEIDLDDWSTRSQAGALRLSDPPDDGGDLVDVDAESSPRYGGFDDEASLRAGGLDALDLFE
ncbi:MAG: DUF6763 family protein [Steroidobacteraceae bacterium]